MAKAAARSFQANTLLVLTFVATSHAYSKPSQKPTPHVHQAPDLQSEALVASDGRVSMPTFPRNRPEHLHRKGRFVDAMSQATLTSGSESYDRVMRSAKSGLGHSLLEARHQLGCTHTKSEVARNCKWQQWRPWTTCTETCGGGSRTRKREIAEHCLNGGDECTGPTAESGMCNEQECPAPTTTATVEGEADEADAAPAKKEEEEEATTTAPPKQSRLKSPVVMIGVVVIALCGCGGVAYHQSSKKAAVMYDEFGEPIETFDVGAEAEDYDYGEEGYS